MNPYKRWLDAHDLALAVIARKCKYDTPFEIPAEVRLLS